MSDSTTAMVECPLCGEDFDPEAAGGWCTNSACGEWRYDGDASTEDAADDAGSDAPETQDPWETLGDAEDDEASTESADSPDPLAESESDDKQTPLEPNEAETEAADEPAAGDVEESAAEDEPADEPELELSDVGESTADEESVDEAESGTKAESAAGGDAEATESEAAAETCPSCDADVDADAEFCPSCGTDLTADEQADEADALTECPSCGIDVGPEDSFCASCGEDLDAHRGDAQTACPSCDADVDPDDRFCASCGQDLEGTGDGARQNGTATNGASAGNVPSSLALTAYGHSVVVGDGDTVGREIRSLLTEAGRPENEAVRIHREHVRFVRENGQFYLVDLGENPTTLNGRSLTKGDREAVEPGDELGLSGTVTLDVERP